jgi:hypothetical protein
MFRWTEQNQFDVLEYTRDNHERFKQAKRFGTATEILDDLFSQTLELLPMMEFI